MRRYLALFVAGSCHVVDARHASENKTLVRFGYFAEAQTFQVLDITGQYEPRSLLFSAISST